MTLIKWSDEGGQIRLGLPSDLDLAMAQPLLEGLRAGFGASDTVIADAAAVERVSTACIQALLAAARHAAEHNRTFTILQPSEVLTEACEDLGLAPWLKQWSRA